MNRARLPCRQLNSQAIKSSVLCYISPIVAGKCSIVSAKCVCKVTEEGFQTAWNNVCKTRELCDEAILGRYLSIVRFCCFFFLFIKYLVKVSVLVLLTGVQNVAFFLSAISAQGPPKFKGKK